MNVVALWNNIYFFKKIDTLLREVREKVPFLIKYPELYIKEFISIKYL